MNPEPSALFGFASEVNAGALIPTASIEAFAVWQDGYKFWWFSQSNMSTRLSHKQDWPDWGKETNIYTPTITQYGRWWWGSEIPTKGLFLHCEVKYYGVLVRFNFKTSW